MGNYEELIDELSENYDIKKTLVKSYLMTLLEYPFIANGEEEKLFLCLERIVAEKSTQKLLSEFNKNRKYNPLFRNLNEIFSEMILRTYGEEAFSFLNAEFLKLRKIVVMTYDDYDETMSDIEKEYNGYSKKRINDYSFFI